MPQHKWVFIVVVGCTGDSPPDPSFFETATAPLIVDSVSERVDSSIETAQIPTQVPPTISRLTIDQINRAKSLAPALGPWEKTNSALTAALGPVMKIEKKHYLWWAQDGETCRVLTVQKLKDSVGTSIVESKSCPK